MMQSYNITDRFKSYFITLWSKCAPKSRVDYLYRRDFGRSLNWQDPKEMNEKIRWLQFNTDTQIWSLLADKYEVNKYLISKGYSNILIKQYGMWEDADSIDFTNLPSSFVVKTTHGAGSVYIVPDKDHVDLENLRTSLKKDLKKKYGEESYEEHYLRIKPRIIAEELLKQPLSLSATLIDYKFYVANGVPICCGVMFNRNIAEHSYDVSYYDLKWSKHEEWLNSNRVRNDIVLPKPENWDKMLQLCKELCSEFPFVRLDLYECNNKVYFGEYTFTPSGLNGGSLSKDMCYYIGSKIRLHR